MAIEYATNQPYSADEFIAVLSSCSLGERRPLHDRDCIEGMVKHGNLWVTARDAGKLVGIARSVTDFHYCCYLSDLAVDDTYQKQGIPVAIRLYCLIFW